MDQKKIYRHFLQLALCLILCLILTGCWSSFLRIFKKGPDPFAKSKLTIHEMKTIATDNVEDFKSAFLLKESTSEYKKAQKLYKAARAKINSWVYYLGDLTIRGDEVPSESEVYQEYSKNAQKAVDEFNDYIKEKMESKSSPVLNTAVSTKVVIDVIVGIGTVGIKWWKTKKELDLQKRERAAEYLLKNYTWDSWRKINY